MQPEALWILGSMTGIFSFLYRIIPFARLLDRLLDNS
jgi:hypothetical protein